MRVALDLDSTLAATSLTAFELMGDGDEYSYDDKPGLAENVTDGTVLLRDHPYNRGAGDDKPNVIRVDSVKTAAEWIEQYT